MFLPYLSVFQIPYEYLTPLQAAVGVVQKVKLHSLVHSIVKNFKLLPYVHEVYG